jgi:F0F1-type ATP synthase gamma subunit
VTLSNLSKIRVIDLKTTSIVKYAQLKERTYLVRCFENLPDLIFAAAILPVHESMYDNERFSKLFVIDNKFGTVVSEEVHCGEIKDIHVFQN